MALSLCGLLWTAVPAQAAPLTNFDTWRGAADLGMWRTKASISEVIAGGEGDNFSANWRLYGRVTYGLGEHWGLQHVHHGMASHEYLTSGLRVEYRGRTNEVNLLYSLKENARVALFVGANRVTNKLTFRDLGSLDGSHTYAQAGLVATTTLSDKVAAYGLAGFGGHGLFQGELGLAYKVRDNWQANLGYRWFRIEDAFDEITLINCHPEKIEKASGDIRVKGMTFGVTYFFGPASKKEAPQSSE